MNNTVKEILSVAAIALFAFGARAETVEVAYRYPVYNTEGVPTSGIREWRTGTTNGTVVTSATKPWGTDASSTSWYVVTNANVEIGEEVECRGYVNLILCKGAKLTIDVSSDGRTAIRTDGAEAFTVYGQPEGDGELVVSGGRYAAGIGGSDTDVTPPITINGGKVTATGGDDGAGIGGCYNSKGSDITINGGTVTATGGSQGAGIGGGNDGNGSNITINGGTVTATGADGVAGIGGGDGGTSSGIRVAEGLLLKAGETENPTAVIEHTGTTDLASIPAFVGKRYVTVEPLVLVARSVKTDGGTAVTNDHVSFSAAFAAIGEGGTGTVSLLADVERVQDDAVQLPNGADIALDLAGRTFSWTTTNGDAPLYIAPGTTGRLAIGDSVGGGGITSRCTSEDSSHAALIVFCAGDGDLTVDGGTFVCSNRIGGATLFYKSGAGAWTFTGGTYRSLGEGVTGAAFLYCGDATGTTVVASGTYDIRATAGSALGIGAGENCRERIRLAGGDFDVVTAGTWYGAFTAGNGSLLVTNGDFRVTASGDGVACFAAERNGTAILSNGTFRTESSAGYAYAAIASATGTLVLAGGTYSARAGRDTAATVCGKEAAKVTVVGSPTINQPDGTAWNLAVELFGATFDFSGYTGPNLPSFAVFADGTYGESYVTGDMTKFSGALIWAGYFSTRPYDWTLAEDTLVVANTDVATKTAYPWAVVPGVRFTPMTFDHVTSTVLTNGAPMELTGAYYLLPFCFEGAKVVYATADGYVFAGGVTAVTNAIATTVSPATADAPAAPFVPVASVTTNGVTTVYATFTNAWRDATDTLHEQSGDILVTMLKDATVQEPLVRLSPLANGKTFTLDLNDKVLAYAGTAAACVVKQTGGQTLRIVDTAATRTPRYFTRAETGLWTLTDEVTELVAHGGLVTGGRAGAVSLTYGTCSISNVNIVGNCSAANGGGVLVSGSGSDLTVTASAFLGNVAATNGGAVYTSRVCSMTDCRVEANVAGGQGGGVHLSSRGSLVRTEVVGNKAGTGGGVYLTFNPGGCFPAGVKILMADGSEKNVEEIAKGDVVATFDHLGGTNASAAVFYVYRSMMAQKTFALSFASGAKLEIADRHDLLAEATRKYVTVSSDDARAHIGKRFWNYATGGWDELVDVTAAKGSEAHYSLYTRGHGNCVADGLLTVPDDKDCFINVYELDANLKADAAQLAADIATYGLATPADYPNVPVGDFEDGNNRFARIAIGKGLVTQEDLLFWFEFDYGPVSAEKPVAAPLRTLAAPQTLGSATVKPTDPYLVIGADTVVTGNVTTAGADSNVYLNQIGKDAVIDVLPEADGFAVGVTLSTGTGMFGWTNEVNHAARFTSDNPSIGVCYTSYKTLELVSFVTVNPQPVEHASADVYQDGVKLEDEPYRVPSNSNAKVVYTVSEEGLYFADGMTAYTNDLDTAKNPAETVGALPAAPQKPSVVVGKPVQRYPWNGVVDVRYRVKNAPAGLRIRFTVTVGATAYDGGTETTATAGRVEGVHAIDFRELGLEKDRGSAKVKAVFVAE